MQTRIKKTYKRCGDGYLLQLSHRIAESLKNNPNFPDPSPEQSVFATACQEFQMAVSIAGRSDRTLSSAKNDKKVALIRMLDELSDYVAVTSNGDRTKLLSSGFDITGEKGASQVLSSIEVLSVEIGPPGEATTRVKRVPGARSYIHQYTPDPVTPDSQWVSETVTDTQVTFMNLQSVTRYWFRVIAIGKGRQVVQSPLVSRVIQ